jgi:hypothetical protein
MAAGVSDELDALFGPQPGSADAELDALFGPRVVADDPGDVFALSDEQVALNQIKAFNLGQQRDLATLERAIQITTGQNREDVMALMKRRGLRWDVDPNTGEFVVDTSAYRPFDPEAGMVAAGKRGVMGLLKTVEDHTWRPVAAGASASAAKSRVRRIVEFSADNDPDAQFLTAGQYLQALKDGTAPDTFLMMPREIDKLGARVFRQEYDQPPRSLDEDVMGFYRDIADTIAGETSDVAGYGLHPEEVEELVTSADKAIVDPVEKGLTTFAYRGIGALAIARKEGESDDAYLERREMALSEAIEDGARGAREFLSVPLMVLADPTTAVSWPTQTANRIGMNFTARGSAALEDSLKAIGDEARSVLRTEFERTEARVTARRRALEEDHAAIEQEIRALGDAPEDQMRLAVKQGQLGELRAERDLLERELEDAATDLGINSEMAGMEEQIAFQRDVVLLVNEAFQKDVPLMGDERTLQAFSRFMRESAPDTEGLRLDSPEALADLQAGYMKEALDEFTEALKAANDEGRVLTGVTPGGGFTIADEPSKRILGVTDAARVRAGAWFMRQLSKTAKGRALGGSRSNPLGLERIRRTASSFMYGPKKTIPLMGATPSDYWRAYERGELLHPAMFAEVADGLQRHNRSANVMADRRRAVLQSWVTEQAKRGVRGSDAAVERMAALRHLDDGDRGRVLAAADVLRSLDRRARLGLVDEGFTSELAAAMGFMKGIKGLRDDLPEIAQLLGSDDLATRTEGLVRLRDKQTFAREQAAEAVQKTMLREMAQTAREASVDTTAIDKALKRGDLGAAMKALDGAGVAGPDVWRLAEEAADRAAARVHLAMLAPEDELITRFRAWDEHIADAARADELADELAALREHERALVAEVDAHRRNLKAAGAMMHDPDQLAATAGAAGAQSLDAIVGQLDVVRALRDEALSTLKEAREQIRVVRNNMIEAQKAASESFPDVDMSEAVRDYARDLAREASLNVQEVNGLFDRLRHMEQFRDLQPLERKQVLDYARGKRPAPKSVEPAVREASNNLRKILRGYARELHEHLVAQGVKGQTVDDVVASLDLTRLLPTITKSDGLQLERALRGEVIRPSYLSPNITEISPKRLRQREATEARAWAEYEWRATGGEGAPPRAWVDQFLKDNWGDINPYIADPMPLLSHFMKGADSDLAGREFIADLRTRFPLGQRLAREFGRDGGVVADSMGYAMVDSAPIVGAHNKLSLPDELKPLHDNILKRLSDGQTSDQILRDIQFENPALVTGDAVRYVKESYNALETPLYVPKPVAEYINWFYRDGIDQRNRIQAALSGGDVPRTMFERTPLKVLLDAHDALHAWNKAMLTIFRTASGYTFVNIVGNVFSGVQTAARAVLNPRNHYVGGMITAGGARALDDVGVIDGRRMSGLELETEMMEDGIMSSATSSAFRKEAGLAQTASSPARDQRLFADRSVAFTDPTRGKRDISPSHPLFGDPEDAAGGLWNTIATAIAESADAEALFGVWDKLGKGARKADVLAAGKELATKAVPKMLAGLPTRLAGGFAGSLIGMATPAGPGVGGLVGFIGAPGWMRIASELNAAVETQARVTIYYGARRAGASRQAAIQQVDDALRNYDEISPFERSVMRRVFGFWTWDAGNIRLQAKWALQNPGKWATLSSIMSAYMRQEFSPEEMRQIPEFARYRFLVNVMGAAVATPDLPQLGWVQSVEKKLEQARVAGTVGFTAAGAALKAVGAEDVGAKVAAQGFVSAREHDEAVGDLSIVLRGLLGVNGGERPEEADWIGTRAGFTPQDVQDYTPQYFQQILGFQINMPPGKFQMSESGDAVPRMELRSTNPRALGLFRQLPLNSVLQAYYKVMLPPKDPRLMPEWELEMEQRALLVATGTGLYPTNGDIEAVKRRDLQRILRELESILPGDASFRLDSDRYFGPTSITEPE